MAGLKNEQNSFSTSPPPPLKLLYMPYNMFSVEHVCRKIAEWACIHVHNWLLHLAALHVFNIIFECGTLCHTHEALERLARRPTRTVECNCSSWSTTICARMASLLLPWHALSWYRRTSVRPPDDIEKSVTHRLHCAMQLFGNFAIQAKSLLQSSLNFLFGGISEERWRLSNRNPPPMTRHKR